jgi:uncharacterized damage-inducible protein DinB
MNIADMKLLYEYNDWANKRILLMAEQVTVEQLSLPTRFSWGSLRGTLVHTLDAEYAWRTLCHHRVLVFDDLKPDDFPDIASIRTRWDAEQDAWRAYLDSLADNDMEEVVSYEVDEGTRNRILWHCLLHVVNHGTQHRSECAAMLTDFDQSPGNIDFTVFLNQR